MALGEIPKPYPPPSDWAAFGDEVENRWIDPDEGRPRGTVSKIASALFSATASVRCQGFRPVREAWITTRKSPDPSYRRKLDVDAPAKNVVLSRT